MSADPDIEEHGALASTSYGPQQPSSPAADPDIEEHADLARAPYPATSPPFPAQEPASPPDDPHAHESQTTEEPAAPPHFAPFFTILEDSATGEHHHPHVHYIFSDDSDAQTDTLTNALLQSLDPEGERDGAAKSSSNPDSASSDHGMEEKSGDESRESSQTPRKTYLHHRARRRRKEGSKQRERYLTLDVSSTGQSIVSAKSLSPEWQISGTEIVNAPTFADHGDEQVEGEGEGEEEAKMMLKVTGAGSAAEDEEGEIKEERVIRSAKRGDGAGKDSEETGNEELVKAMQGLTEKLRREFEDLRRWVPSEKAASDV
ncbi:MAG: hypothetical protein M1831_005521 [Alyxoria varia]|nr:MAG: hypothetical protein M1831_005521 [Alyxoria varia]